MLGLIFSVIAGLAINIQNGFNSRLSSKIGLLETTVVVHGVGLIFGFIVTLFLGRGDYSKIVEVNKLSLTGGAIGVVIVYSIMMGINKLGATYSTIIMMITQLLVALAMDQFGLFGLNKIPFKANNFIGLAIIIVGIIIFKL